MLGVLFLFFFIVTYYFLLMFIILSPLNFVLLVLPYQCACVSGCGCVRLCYVQENTACMRMNYWFALIRFRSSVKLWDTSEPDCFTEDVHVSPAFIEVSGVQLVII